MRVSTASEASGPKTPNEDWACATEGLIVVLDGATARTDTGCISEADRYPFGSAEKQAALLRMKHAELAARNRPGGYGVAAENSIVTIHSIQGKFLLDEVRRIAVLTDGAARIVDLFGLLDWPAVLDVLDDAGPTELIRRVRAIEAADPTCTRWARNKRSDDATAAYAA